MDTVPENTAPEIRKWSELHNMAVVSVNEGKKVGTCDDFYFEPNSQVIYALKIKTGMLSHKVLPAASINTIGQDAITITSEGDLQGKGDDGKLATLPLGEILHSYKVMSASGTVVGTLGNILIDVSTPTAPRVTDFELTRGLRERIGRKYETFSANEVISYGQDVLVISDAEAQQLNS